jgi:Uma2 family endonuclease
MATKTKAIIEGLYNIAENGKAEIVSGELVLMSPTGAQSGRAGGEIYFSLRLYEEQSGGGYAFPDNVGFVVNLPDRDSFSPDAAWYIGDVEGMDFVEGAPVFAVEVRSKNDYGPQAEQAIARKIRDYFAAGTQVVWDVDLLSDVVIKKYVATDPENPTLFRRGEIADAEPAVPGWKMPVDRLFGKR